MQVFRAVVAAHVEVVGELLDDVADARDRCVGNERLASARLLAGAAAGLAATPDAAPWTGEIKLKGTATVNGQKVTREARAGCVVWPVQPQQNITAISRPCASLALAVRGKAPFSLRPAIDKPTVAQGDRAVVKVQVERHWPDVKNPIQVQVMQSPQSQGPPGTVSRAQAQRVSSRSRSAPRPGVIGHSA